MGVLEFEVEKSAMKVAQVWEPDLFWEYRAISNLRILVPSKPYNKEWTPEDRKSVV